MKHKEEILIKYGPHRAITSQGRKVYYIDYLDTLFWFNDQEKTIRLRKEVLIEGKRYWAEINVVAPCLFDDEFLYSKVKALYRKCMESYVEEKYGKVLIIKS